MSYNIIKTNRKTVWRDLLALARCDFRAPSARTDSGMLVNGHRDLAWAAMLRMEPACYIDAERTPRLFAAVDRFKKYNNNK
jgi:hypothetical protein